MQIIDCFMWSYEREAVAIRVETLKDSVDLHIAVQATNTFRGLDRSVEIFEHPKVVNIILTIPYKYDGWESEKWLRNQLLRVAKIHSKPGDLLVMSDGDEIPHPEAIREYSGKPMKLMTDYRNFYANLRAVNHILEHQPTIGTYKDYINAHGVNSARWYANWPMSKNVGWHLSSLGDTSIEKLETFSHDEYDTIEVKESVYNARNNMRDFLNRFDMEWTTDIPSGVPDHLMGGKDA